VRNNFTIINVYKKRTTKSEIVTQLLYGDIFKKLEKKGIWLKIKNNEDNYEGFIKERNFSNKNKNTHKISKLYSNLYSKPNIKNKVNKMLSFGSKINVSEKKGNFYKFDNLWIKKKDLKNINFKEKKVFNNINKFKNVKYKWGGKSFKGIDCSALVQIFLNFNNKFCPRDAKDQIKYFKKKIKLKNIKKNDIIFWKGHVAIAISEKKLIHAYGPLKKVVVMPIKQTINRIYNTANLKLTGIRRII
tara:strand:- start:2181 stop:2915 length:735 start_codon:yes stop_codon:yes gene_type:complete